jgi:uncharacterized protein with PIN domain
MITIRDRLRRRMQRTSIFAAASVMGLSAGLVHYPLLPMVLILIVWNVIVFSIAFVVIRLTRCPICKARLGAATRKATKEKPTVDRCPHCGVSFDEPVDSLVNAE